jgi:hypothetical protein
MPIIRSNLEIKVLKAIKRRKPSEEKKTNEKTK